MTWWPCLQLQLLQAGKARRRKRATVFVTSGAMTFILMAATLVTATFLMSPTIEQIFGENYFFLSTVNKWSSNMLFLFQI